MHIYEKPKLLVWSMFFICSIFYGYEFLLRVTPSIMVSDLMTTYNITATQVGVISAYYYFTYTPLQLVAGTLIDHYGAKFLLTICVLACVIGTYFFGMTDSIILAKFGRASIGFGSAFAFVGVLRICSDWLPSNLFATLTGINTTIGMLGAISGEVFLEQLKHSVGLYNIFLGCIIFGIALLVAVWFVVESKQLIVVKQDKRAEFKSLLNHMLFLIKKPIFWHVALIGLCLFLPTTIFASLWSVKFISDVYHVQHAANYSSMIFLGWAIGSPIVGLLKKNALIADKAMLIIGNALAFTVAYLIIYQPELCSNYLYWFMLAFGLFSSVEILVFDLNHILSGPALCGTAVALTNMIVMFGGFVQPLVGQILDFYHTGSNNYHYSLAEYQIALMIIPIAFFLGIILSIMLKPDKIVPPDSIPD